MADALPRIPDHGLGDVQAASVLQRLGFGPRPGEVAALRETGFRRWVETQLAPPPDDGPEVAARLSTMRLRIHYPAGPGTPGPQGVPQIWPAADEMRPLGARDRPIEALWPLTDHTVAIAPQERARPRDEVIAATLLRAVYSPWQLREVLVGFWHDHFNVDAYGGGEQIAVALPVYDRDVIRAHALGNFRAMLEAVATSTAMQYYLSNHSSRAGAANENYGRELFELHTLGRDAYLNDRYDRWRLVPGALAGHPVGYIDEDVYEAARAFTGWTIEDGARLDDHAQLPRTGRFRYVEAWHDGYQKRVLATDFDPFQPPMADGRRVLDLVAHHPATAHFIATKLCRRLIGQHPPEATVRMAAAVFRAQGAAPDQIARTVSAILLSPGFRQARRPKMRRPLAIAAAFARATGLDFTPTEALHNALATAGQRVFGWSTPDGFPDDDIFLLTANGLRQNWTLVFGLAGNVWGNGTIPPESLAPLETASATEVARSWLAAFHGAADPDEVSAVAAALSWPPDRPVGPPGDPDTMKRLAAIAGYAAMTPRFQTA